ncbi:MAG: polyphosphate kinase 1 [Bacteroidales bacterium]|nr:polyphosphate kinase 1 [Bacteroidales bacterium]
MNSESKYYNRELSWLSFNQLVLEQIQDRSLPIFERIKFLAIYSSNLDEFYRVRVAYHRSLTDLSSKNRKALDYNPEKVLESIKKEVFKQQVQYEKEFYTQIIPELEKIGITIFDNQELEEIHEEFIKEYFSKELFPEIQPVLLSSSGAVMSFLKDNVIYLAIKMMRKNRPEHKRPRYAVIQVPSGTLGRFIQLPKYKGNYFFIFLEDMIRQHLTSIFPGYEILSSYSIKLSRNADLMIEDEFSGNLLGKLRKSLKQRKTGFPARFSFDRAIPESLLDVLKLAFNLTEKDFVPVGKYLNFSDFFTFSNPLSPKYELDSLKSLKHPVLEKYDSILDAVDENDLLLHFPYHTYDYVLRFFSEAAVDPDVIEIKTTQYRVATNSAIVNALIAAAGNGKDVTVFVEVKARFDEETNFKFADRMKAAGINVIAGIPGLKVHVKAALVIRKQSKKKNNNRAYAFLSTGNFNEKTATQYSDEGYFTSDKAIIKDLRKLFLYLETPLDNFNFKKILVPRFNMLEAFKEKINREIKNSKEGKKAYLIFKMNGLGDKEIIDMLYDASSENVNIDLIVRGICKLRPGMPYSKNIKITRIVDRFLEHSRIYAFYNSGNWEVYISSSDLLTRNLRRRVEALIPVCNKELINEIIELLQIQLKDNTKAKFLDNQINNINKKIKKNSPLYRAQIDTYLYLQKKTLMTT